jgi:hypothetical protein
LSELHFPKCLFAFIIQILCQTWDKKY